MRQRCEKDKLKCRFERGRYGKNSSDDEDDVPYSLAWGSDNSIYVVGNLKSKISNRKIPHTRDIVSS